MATINVRAKTYILYNEGPTLKEKEKLSFVSLPLLIKHCPEGKNPTTIKEFLEVCKNYTEVVVNTKTKKPGGWTHESYRCLFSRPKAAQQYYDTMYNQLQKVRQADALKQCAPTGKVREALEAMGDDIEELMED